MTKETCWVCEKEYEAKYSESACPECFAGCYDPGYHGDESCDQSC